MRTRRMNRLVAPALAALLITTSGGCIVESQCLEDLDCPASERCRLQTGQCYLECTSDSECWAQGKECIDNRCIFRFDERPAAPPVCLDVVNPKSSYFGKKLCVSQLGGKVVMIYFALLA